MGSEEGSAKIPCGSRSTCQRSTATPSVSPNTTSEPKQRRTPPRQTLLHHCPHISCLRRGAWRSLLYANPLVTQGAKVRLSVTTARRTTKTTRLYLRIGESIIAQHRELEAPQDNPPSWQQHTIGDDDRGCNGHLVDKDGMSGKREGPPDVIG